LVYIAAVDRRHEHNIVVVVVLLVGELEQHSIVVEPIVMVDNIVAVVVVFVLRSMVKRPFY
jgi:hypothetical protein